MVLVLWNCKIIEHAICPYKTIEINFSILCQSYDSSRISLIRSLGVQHRGNFIPVTGRKKLGVIKKLLAQLSAQNLTFHLCSRMLFLVLSMIAVAPLGIR